MLLQKLGLEITPAKAIHLRDAKQGALVPLTLPYDEDFINLTIVSDDDDTNDSLDTEEAPLSYSWTSVHNLRLTPIPGSSP